MIHFSGIRNIFLKSVRRQLIIGVALVHAVLMSLFIFDLVLRQEKMLIEHQTERAIALAQTLSVSSAGWLAANDIAGLEEILEAQQYYPELRFAMLTNTGGIVLSHTDREKLGLKVIDMPAAIHIDIIGQDNELVDVAVPVMLAGRHVGWTRVGIGSQKTQLKIHEIARDGVLYAFIAIIAGSIMAGFMGRKLTGRLYAIQKTINAIKTGSRESRTEMKGMDEAAILANEFNAMLDTLSQRDAELQKKAAELRNANQNLEKTVLERTQQLSDSLAHAQKREFELKMAQSVAHIGSWMLDITNDTLTWSDETYRIFGIEIGTPLTVEIFSACIHPDDRDSLLAAWSAAMTGSLYDIEHRICVADKVKWVHEKAQMKFDKEGKAISGIGIVQDITDIKHYELALKEREELYRSMFNSHSIMLLIDPQTAMIEDANQAAGRFYGYPLSQMRNMKITDINTASPEIVNSEMQAVKKKKKSHFDFVHRLADGTLRNVEVYSGNVRVHGKTLLHSIIFDVTQRRQAEERLRTIFDYSPDAYLLMDFNTSRISECNPAAEAMLRGTKDQIIGKSPAEISPPYQPDGNTSKAAAAQRIRESRQNGAHRFEWVHRRFDGSDFWADVSLIVMTLSSRPVLFLAWRDITERKRIEHELDNTLESLAKSNKELEHFAYIASHDLQEPLRMVSSYVQLLSRRYTDTLDEDANEFIKFAVDGATRMKGLIDALLSYARVNTRGRELIPVNSEQVLSGTLKSLELSIAEKKAIIRHDPLPMINADEIQLGQLFQNLISNAIKFIKPGVPPRVNISVQREFDIWHFSVADNGIGIDLKDKDRIFLIFQRLHTRQHYSGTGIGLSLCQKIVERHGGQIWVESEKDSGLTVHFTIPAILDK